MLAEELSLLGQAILAAGGGVDADRGYAALLSRYGPERMNVLRRTWDFVARPNQIIPAEPRTTLLLSGRGWGKNFALTGYCHRLVDSGQYGRIAIVAPTTADTRDVIVEGDSGLLKWSPPTRPRPVYKPSKRRVTFWNGSTVTLFSAEDPDSLRGPQFHAALVDELAAHRYPEKVWNGVKFITRLRLHGAGTKRAIATTPRPIPLIRQLVKDPRVRVIKGTTFENRANLDDEFIEEMEAVALTRLGRQEISAEILDDNPNALWNQARIESLRVTPEPEHPNRLLLDGKVVADLTELRRIGIGVDPAVTDKPKSDETGIVVAGVGPCRCRGEAQEHGFVLDDVSGRYNPRAWAGAIATAYERWKADRVFAEVNNGGQLVEANLRAHEAGRALPYKAIHASRGKQIRHEPIAALYERGAVHHLGTLPKLEDQQVQWDPTVAKSPDRLDALVIVLSELMLGRERKPGQVGVTTISS